MAKLKRLPLSIDVNVAVMLVLFLWLVYTVLQTLFVVGYLSEAWSTLLGFVPGALGVGALLRVGRSRADCSLQFRGLSWAGLGVLVAIFIFALAAVLPFGTRQGWSWVAALVYAPAGGISQELFFRSALLPSFLMVFKNRRWLALGLHALLFGLWHIGPLFLGAPLWAVLAVMFVPFLSGLGWGWQVQRDRTVAWAMLQHSLILAIVSQYSFPG